MGLTVVVKLHAHEVVLVPDECLRSLKSKMTASSSVNQPKGIVMKQEQCVESKCSKNSPGA